MAAALGRHLVLELDGAGAGALERAHGVPDIERIAEAGVGIDDDRQINDIADGGRVLHQLGQADEAQVRKPQERVG